jgi:hypothetical protein
MIWIEVILQIFTDFLSARYVYDTDWSANEYVCTALSTRDFTFFSRRLQTHVSGHISLD